MRIALVDPSNQTVPYIDYLAQALADLGHEVSIWCSEFIFGSGRPPVARSVEFRHQFYRIASQLKPTVLRRFAKVVEHSPDMFRARMSIRSWAPDVVHFQQTPIPVLDNSLIRLFKGLAPLVFTVHNPDVLHGEHSLLGARYASFLSKFDHLIAHTQSTQSWLDAGSDAGANGTSTIRPGVYRHYSDSRLNRPIPELAVLEAVSGSNVLLFGNMRGYKGYEVAFRAFASAMRSTALPVRLIVAGNPFNMKQRLVDDARQLGIEDDVVWIPRYVDDDQVDHLFDAADIVMAPHLNIDLSGILMTALNYPIAFIASNTGSFAEYLTDGEHGRLYPPGDDAAASTALQDLLTVPGELKRVQNNVLQLGRSWVPWSEVADRHVQLYRELRSDD